MEAVLNSSLWRDLPNFSRDLQLDLGLRVRQRDQRQAGLLAVKSPPAALHSSLEKAARCHLERIPEALLPQELRLALAVFTKPPPGALQLSIALRLEDHSRAGDDLDLPGRIRELFLAKPCVFRSANAKHRRDNLRAVMNLNPGFPAAVVTTQEVEIKGIQDAWNAVAERRRPDADRLPGSGASLGYGRGRRPGPLTSDPGNQPALTAAAAGLNHDEHIPWIAIYPAAQIQARLARVMPDGLDAFEKKMCLPGPMGRGERQVPMNPARRLVGKEKSTGEQESDRSHRSQLVPSYRAGGQDTADLQVADRLLRLREGPVKKLPLKLRPLRRSPRLRGKLFAELDNIGELALEVS